MQRYATGGLTAAEIIAHLVALAQEAPLTVARRPRWPQAVELVLRQTRTYAENNA
jgi:hypothetical protein